ncbi:MAG: hypothetical protein ABSD80_13240 [Caulobacteraceae bacterium]|jgi:hypothetical protein
MPNFAAMWAGFMNAMHTAWAAFMTLITTLTTLQLVLGIVGIIGGLWIAKIVFSPGGPRRRMKGMAAVWLMIPLVVAMGGVIIYFVIQILAKSPAVVT